ncbi:MAG: nucleotidyltransferase family protein, partial [Vicinamibacterales bacterium]
DVLIPETELPLLETVLERFGYVPSIETSGRLVSYQSHYHRTDRYGVTHAFDVHWRISNLQSASGRFTHAELWDRRMDVPALDDAAVAVDDVFALLIALVHRAAHHPGSTNLLWIYDLEQLARRLTPEELDRVRDIATDRGLAQIAADGLALAQDFFGGEKLEGLVAALRNAPSRRDDVPLMGGSLTQAHVLRLDLRALPTWRARVRLLREHLLPPADYMRARYGVGSTAWLPVFYGWRVVRGIPRWLARAADTQ